MYEREREREREGCQDESRSQCYKTSSLAVRIKISHEYRFLQIMPVKER